MYRQLILVFISTYSFCNKQFIVVCVCVGVGGGGGVGEGNLNISTLGGCMLTGVRAAISWNLMFCHIHL